MLPYRTRNGSGMPIGDAYSSGYLFLSFEICILHTLLVAFFFSNLSLQIVDIPVGINCAPLLADMFLYSYEVKYIQSKEIVSISVQLQLYRYIFVH